MVHLHEPAGSHIGSGMPALVRESAIGPTNSIAWGINIVGQRVRRIYVGHPHPTTRRAKGRRPLWREDDEPQSADPGKGCDGQVSTETAVHAARAGAAPGREANIAAYAMKGSAPEKGAAGFFFWGSSRWH